MNFHKNSQIFSLIFEFPPEKVVELNLTQDTNLLTFPTKDVFVKAACHIARGGTLEVIGKPVESINEKHSFMAVIGSDSIRGSVVYIDSYGNVISNITERLFVEVGKGRSFTIMFRKRGDEIHQISELYTDVAEGEKLALFGSTGMLEIAMNIGHAKNLLGFNENDIVNIEKGGEIIPKIVGVDLEKRNFECDKIEFVENCPSCFKILSRKYIDNIFVFNQREDSWLADGLQTYLMIKYVEKYGDYH